MYTVLSDVKVNGFWSIDKPQTESKHGHAVTWIIPSRVGRHCRLPNLNKPIDIDSA
jgi:hypothetical protein